MLGYSQALDSTLKSGACKNFPALAMCFHIRPCQLDLMLNNSSMDSARTGQCSFSRLSYLRVAKLLIVVETRRNRPNLFGIDGCRFVTTVPLFWLGLVRV